MPKPRIGEKKNDYISRCIEEVLSNGEAKSQDQAIAICESKWTEGSAYRSTVEKHIKQYEKNS